MKILFRRRWNVNLKQVISWSRLFSKNVDGNGEWKRLHHKEINSLYRSPNRVRVIKSRRLKWAGHIARIEEGRGALKMFTCTPRGKRPLGRPRRWCEDNIRMDLKLIGIKYIQSDGFPCTNRSAQVTRLQISPPRFSVPSSEIGYTISRNFRQHPSSNY